MSKEIINSFHLQVAMRLSVDNAVAMRNPFFTPEHLVSSILVTQPVIEALKEMGVEVSLLRSPLRNYIRDLEAVPDDIP